MRYKYVIFITSRNHLLKKSVWCGKEFAQKELTYMKEEAIDYFNGIVEEEKVFKHKVVVGLIKAETDNWYWDTKNVVLEEKVEELTDAEKKESK